MQSAITIPEAFTIAVQHHQAGRLAEAEQIYRQILAVDPRHADSLHNLGLIALQSGKPSFAVDLIRQAIAFESNQPGYYYDLGNALLALGLLDDAAAAFGRALEWKPDFFQALNNLAGILHLQGRLDSAIVAYRRLLALQPGLAEVHCNLGTALQAQGNLDEAVACFQRSLNLKPDAAETHNNLANALRELGQIEEALASSRRAIDLQPNAALARSNLLYTLAYCPGLDATSIYDAHDRFYRQWAEPLSKNAAPHANHPDPKRRLRIGYVSPNFQAHVLALFLVPLLASHDHQQFEIVCYADVPNPDELTARLRSYADKWVPISGRSLEDLARLIREDGIDILVDLTMHMHGSHLPAFARRPAPVQVCWLAYPGTTGLKAIDYRLTDPYLDPPGLYDRNYFERSVRLPDCFWCYDPLTSEPAVNSLPAVGNDRITFGCLNNFCKVNRDVLHLWARVLDSVRGSRLLLLAPEGSARQNVTDVFEQAGISSERIAFVARQPRARYLELYNQIDIGLDTFPYNGHTTSLDSFWMGVPVVTLVGNTVVGRAGVCQLQNLGLPELIAQTPDRFVHIATDLATDLPRLSRLRAGLRERMEKSPLMDAPRFARNIEAAYRNMWHDWCASHSTMSPA